MQTAASLQHNVAACLQLAIKSNSFASSRSQTYKHMHVTLAVQPAGVDGGACGAFDTACSAGSKGVTCLRKYSSWESNSFRETATCERSAWMSARAPVMRSVRRSLEARKSASCSELCSRWPLSSRPFVMAAELGAGQGSDGGESDSQRGAFGRL